MLCEDEIARRDAARCAPRPPSPLRAATTLEDFDFAYNPEIPAALIRDLATLRFVDAGEVGDPPRPGRGRQDPCSPKRSAIGLPPRATALAVHQDQPPARRPRRRPRRPHLGSPAPALGHDPTCWSSTTSRCATSPPSQADDLYELITERAGRGASSSPPTGRPSDWYPLFPNPVVAESILDRLINTAHHVHMDGRSYRPMGRPGRRTEATEG